MTTRPAGLVIDLEATPTLAAHAPDSIVLGFVGTAANATDAGGDAVARRGSIYVLNSLLPLSRAAWTAFDGVVRANGDPVSPADFFGAGTLLDSLILAETIGNFFVVLIPVDPEEPTEATSAIAALNPAVSGGTHPVPGIAAAPGAIGPPPAPTVAVPDPVDNRPLAAAALHALAPAIDAQVVIDIPSAEDTATLRKTFAGTYLPTASTPGTIRRSRVTLGTSRTGVTGVSDVFNSTLLAIYMALVQSEDLGEDPANTPTIITSTNPVLVLDISDFTTPAQDLAGAYITPVVRYGGSFRFWGRATGPDPDDDAGYVGVIDAILTEMKALLGSYSQRNLPGETIDIIVSRGQHLLDHRRRLGQITDGIVARHPNLNTPERLHANELYLLLAVQRVPYGRIIHLQVSPHGVSVLGTTAPTA